MAELKKIHTPESQTCKNAKALRSTGLWPLPSTSMSFKLWISNLCKGKYWLEKADKSSFWVESWKSKVRVTEFWPKIAPVVLKMTCCITWSWGRIQVPRSHLPSLPLPAGIRRLHLFLGSVSSPHLSERLLTGDSRTVGSQVGFLCPGSLQKIP